MGSWEDHYHQPFSSRGSRGNSSNFRNSRGSYENASYFKERDHSRGTFRGTRATRTNAYTVPRQHRVGPYREARNTENQMPQFEQPQQFNHRYVNHPRRQLRSFNYEPRDPYIQRGYHHKKPPTVAQSGKQRKQGKQEHTIEDTEPEEESANAYETQGIVYWTYKEKLGIILCEKNLQNGNIHFYFDKDTLIDGTCLSEYCKQQPFPLNVGVRIEFKVILENGIQIDKSGEHRLIHVQNIYLDSNQSECTFEEMKMELLYPGDELEHMKIGRDANMNKIAIPGCLFYLDEIRRTIRIEKQNKVFTVSNKKKEKLLNNIMISGRCIKGQTMKSPLWIGDVVGTRLLPKSILVTCEDLEPLKQSYGTVVKAIPNLFILIRDDTGKNVFCSTVSLSKTEYNLLRPNQRVSYDLTENLPMMSYEWKALNIKPVTNNGLYSNVAIPTDILIDFSTGTVSTGKVPDSIASEGEEGNDELWEVPDYSPSANKSRTSEREKIEETTSSECSEESSTDENYFGGDDNPLRCNFEVLSTGQRYQDVPHCHKTFDPKLMTVPTILKTVDRYFYSEDEVDDDGDEIYHSMEKLDKIEKVKKVVTPKKKKEKLPPPPEFNVPSNILPPEIKIIGLYDDIGTIFEESLLTSRLSNKKQKPVDHTKVKDVSKQWYIRKSPRVLPTVIVAELIENRNIHNDIEYVDVNALTSTVVLRSKDYENRPIKGKKSKAKKPVIEEIPRDENINSDEIKVEKQEVPQPVSEEPKTVVNKPVPLQSEFGKHLISDPVLSSFFSSLMPKRN